MAIVIEPIAPEYYWRTLAQKTRLEPIGLLVLVAILLERVKRGEAPNVTFSGTDAFKRLAQKTCPWLEAVRWRIPAPEERVDVHLPLELVETPRELVSTFLDVFERDIVRRPPLREEFVGSLISWLERDRQPDSTWIVGEERALIASFRRALKGRHSRYATPMSALALAFLALRAYSLDVEVEQLRSGVLDLRGLTGPFFVVPEPNMVTGRAPIGAFQQNEYNYANAALYGEDRFIALVSGGALFRTLGEDAEIKERLLRSERLTAVIAFPQSVAVISGHEALGAFLCEEKPPKKEDKKTLIEAEARWRELFGESKKKVALVTFPRIRHTRLAWPKKWVEGLKKVLEGESVAGFDRVEEDIETLAHDRWILTANTRLYDPGEEVLDRLVEERSARTLETFVEVIRCHSIGQTVESVVEDEEIIVREATPNDINDWGVLQRPNKQVRRTTKNMQMRRIERQTIQPGDILFAQRGRIGMVSLVESIPEGECWVAGQLFLILRVRWNSPINDPVYLLRFLQSEPVHRYWARVATNTAVPQIRVEDLENLQVPLPDKERGIAQARASYRAILELSERITALQVEAQKRMEAVDI